MDKASDFGSEDSRFESWRGRVKGFHVIFQLTRTKSKGTFCHENLLDLCPSFSSLLHYKFQQLTGDLTFKIEPLRRRIWNPLISGDQKSNSHALKHGASMEASFHLQNIVVGYDEEFTTPRALHSLVQ